MSDAMSYETAKVLIKETLMNDVHYRDKPLYTELCGTISEALEKQIGRPPVIVDTMTAGHMWCCPNCGHWLREAPCFRSYLPDYCSGCGTRIDWENREGVNDGNTECAV